MSSHNCKFATLFCKFSTNEDFSSRLVAMAYESKCPIVGVGRDTSHTADLNSLCFFVEPLIHLVGSNDAIIHGAKPARHNDTDGTSVIKAFDLV